MVLLLLLNIEVPSHLPLPTRLSSSNYKFILVLQVFGFEHLPLEIFASLISRFEQINLHSSFWPVFYHVF